MFDLNIVFILLIKKSVYLNINNCPILYIIAIINIIFLYFLFYNLDK